MLYLPQKQFISGVFGKVEPGSTLSVSAPIRYPILDVSVKFLDVDDDPILMDDLPDNVDYFTWKADGEPILDETPEQHRYINDFYNGRLGMLDGVNAADWTVNNVDDGIVTFSPYRRHIAKELELSEGKPKILSGRTLAWGTADLGSLILEIKLAAALPDLDGGRVLVEILYDVAKGGKLGVPADEERGTIEPLGDYYTVRRANQNTNGTGWMELSSIFKKGEAVHFPMAIHLFGFGAGVVDASEGFKLSLNGAPFWQVRPAELYRDNIRNKRWQDPLVPSYSIDLLSDDLFSTLRNIGTEGGISEAAFEVNWSTLPTGGTFTMVLESVKRWKSRAG